MADARAQLGRVLSWLSAKAELSLADTEAVVLRLSRNFRLDRRPDYTDSGQHLFAHVSEKLLARVCCVGRHLKLVLDTVVLGRRHCDPMPKFLTPAPLNLESAFPPSIGENEPARATALGGKVLLAFLTRLWAPLRYAEQLAAHLNSYCAGLQDLKFSNSGGNPPKDSDGLAQAVLSLLSQLSMQLARIEVFVLTKHHRPPANLISDLVALRGQLMAGTLNEADYRSSKNAALEKLVDFNLEKFRPTVFFQLASPDEAARASVSPLGWESGGLRQPSAKNSSKSVFGNGEVKEGATIEQLMSLASAPLTPAASRPKDVSGAFARKNTAEIAQKAGKVAVQSPGARHTVAFGERPKWEQSGALDVPRFDFDQTFAETSESRPAAGQRGTVSFEPQQLQKLVELERMKESAQSLFANHSPNDAAPPIALAAPAVEAASVECHSKTWEVPRRGPVSLKVELGSLFVCGGALLPLSVSLSVSARHVAVEGLDVVLRDPEFAKLGQMHIRSRQNNIFPLKVGEKSMQIFFRLPAFLAPSSGRSRHTLQFVLVGRKVKDLQLSIPLAAAESDKMWTLVPTHVFGAPLLPLSLREKTPTPRVLSLVCEWLAENALPQKGAKWFERDALSASEEERMWWLRDQLNRGVEISLKSESSERVVAQLWLSFVCTLPEPLVPADRWPDVKAAVASGTSGTASGTSGTSGVGEKLLALVPGSRVGAVSCFLSLLSLLSSRLSLSPLPLSSVVCRPPLRASDALSPPEAATAAAALSALLAAPPAK